VLENLAGNTFERVSNELLPLMVGQSHDSFTLLGVKDVMLFQHCQQAIQVLFRGYRLSSTLCSQRIEPPGRAWCALYTSPNLISSRAKAGNFYFRLRASVRACVRPSVRPFPVCFLPIAAIPTNRFRPNSMYSMSTVCREH
jgi:hypothetical protein